MEEVNKENVDDFLKQLEENGVGFINKSELCVKDVIAVDIDSMLDVDVSLFTKYNMYLTIQSSRGHKYYIDIFEDDNRFCLKLITEMPDAYTHFFRRSEVEKPIATTFADFCWIHSEGTTELNKDEVATNYREETNLGDLTWVLPSKFADDIIEVLHIFNQRVAQGILEDAILYGPFYSI